jgi:hypothetical protein
MRGTRIEKQVETLPLTWGRKQIQLPKRCSLWFLEYWITDQVQKLSNSEFFLSGNISDWESYPDLENT